MSDKVGLYIRPESNSLTSTVADGVRASGLHPCFRNPFPFDENQIEDFAWVVIFATTGKSESIAREYLKRNVPVILLVFSEDNTVTVMSLNKRDGNRKATEWKISDMQVGLPFRQCTNVPLPGVTPMYAAEKDELPPAPAPLPEDKVPDPPTIENKIAPEESIQKRRGRPPRVQTNE